MTTQEMLKFGYVRPVAKGDWIKIINFASIATAIAINNQETSKD